MIRKAGVSREEGVSREAGVSRGAGVVLGNQHRRSKVDQRIVKIPSKLNLEIFKFLEMHILSRKVVEAAQVYH